MTQGCVTQAIQTKFLGPTNSHGSRIKAWCQAKSIIRPVDHGLSIEARHYSVAMELCNLLGWQEHGPLIQGALPDPSNGYCFVQSNAKG